MIGYPIASEWTKVYSDIQISQMYHKSAECSDKDNGIMGQNNIPAPANGILRDGMHTVVFAHKKTSSIYLMPMAYWAL